MDTIYYIDETEWWDRVAVAVSLLEKKPGTCHLTVQDGKDVVECYVSADLKAALEKHQTQAPPQVTAYLFNHLDHSEILRRLNQMPDETPLDLLMSPYVLYCPENNSLVSVNSPQITLGEHLQKLREVPS